MVVLVVGYYFYLSNREISPNDATIDNEEVAKLISRNLEGEYYPEFPRDVVVFYSRIVKAYYHTTLTEGNVESLGNQARKLFDAELLAENPEEEFYKNLKDEIREYNELERIIYEYTVEKSSGIEKFTFQDREYAKVKATYMLREKGTLATSYEEYTLRKDSDGKWKILYWESYVPSDLDNE